MHHWEFFSDLLLQDPVAPRWLTDSTVPFDPQLAAPSPGGIWIHVLLFISFTMLVVLRVFDFRRMLTLLQGFVRSSSVALMYREESALASRVSVFLIVNYLVLGSLFVWQTLSVQSDSFPAPFMMVWIAAGLLLVYIVKIISVRILGFIFEAREAAQEYVYNIVLFNKTLGLFLFPVVLCLAYAHQLSPQWLVIIGLSGWAIILIYRLVRMVWIGLSIRGISFFYIILYLCTLEILPFVVIVKALTQFN